MQNSMYNDYLVLKKITEILHYAADNYNGGQKATIINFLNNQIARLQNIVDQIEAEGDWDDGAKISRIVAYLNNVGINLSLY